jgi:hypothetical protein
MARQYVSADGSFIDEQSTRQYVDAGGLLMEETQSTGTYLYIGADVRANHYKGTRTDAQFYLGTKTGIFSA